MGEISKAGAVVGTLIGLAIGMVGLSRSANRPAPVATDTIYVLQDSGMRMIVFPKGDKVVVINSDSVHTTLTP